MILQFYIAADLFSAVWSQQVHQQHQENQQHQQNQQQQQSQQQHWQN